MAVVGPNASMSTSLPRPRRRAWCKAKLKPLGSHDRFSSRKIRYVVRLNVQKLSSVLQDQGHVAWARGEGVTVAAT